VKNRREGFKSNKQAYANMKSHGDAVQVKNIGAVECFEQETIMSSDTIFGASNGDAAAEAGGGERGRCFPPDVTAEYVGTYGGVRW
jgi:hypothetical protein